MLSDEEINERLALVLSCGYINKVSEEVIMKRTSYSLFFIAVENSKETPVLYEDSKSLLSKIYYDIDIETYDYTLFSQCLWVSELYLYIEKETKMTFEAIFLYLPLYKAYSLYPLYHEMDFIQAIDYFKALTKKESLLSIIMKKRGITIEELANASGLSYATISSLKREQKDISKVGAYNYLKLVNHLNVKAETLISGVLR